MADTTINPPSSSLKLYYRVARFAWQSGEQYLGFTSDLYFRLPSSHIYETCENFICWETEWIALPAHRSAAETASISILSSGELCSGEVAANERSESATGQTSPSEYTASLTEAELLAECEVAEVLARIEVALDEARSWEWMVTYWSNRLTVDCWRGTVMAIGVIDNYGTVINLPRRVFLQHFTYTH
jgi:hypothetical protein